MRITQLTKAQRYQIQALLKTGNVEKSRQRRSRHFVVLTYCEGTLRASKQLWPCWTNFFDQFLGY